MTPEPTQDVLNRYKLPTITICVGIMAAICIFIMMLNVSIRQLERDFTGDARLHMTMVEDWLALNIDELRELSHALATRQDSGENTFHLMADPVISRQAFGGIYWITYKQGAAQPLTLKTAIMQENIATVPLQNTTIVSALLEALRQPSPQASEITYLSSRDQKPRIAFILPIVSGEKVRGAIVALLNPEKIFSRAFNGRSTPYHTDGYIFSIGKDGEERMLYGRDNELSQSPLFAPQILNADNIERSAAFSYSETISLPFGQWKVIFVPVSQYMSKANMLMPWLMMAACLVLTGMAGIFLFQLINQKARIEQVVQEKTAELEKAIGAAVIANAAKSDFLASMSHEVRTPLNSIIGMAELLLETELTTQQESHIRIVLASAETLLEIINDILDLSKIEAGQLKLDPIAFDLETAIEETAELFMPRIQEKEQPIELLVHFTPGTPRHAIGDSLRVRQILSNLISNAVKFTQGGYILVNVSEIPEKTNTDHVAINISVRDTGIGIPPDKLQGIFDKFSQADTSTTRKFGGTGLGLSICRQLAQLMQGEVTATSVPGEGSTFCATLTFGRDHETHPDLFTFDHALLADKRVLIVDDLKPSRDILVTQMGGMAGMYPAGAPDNATALRMLAEAKKGGAPFDLVVTDYLMSDTTSDMFAQQVKALYPDMPVVVVTAWAEKGYTQIFASAGCDAYLTKPVRATQLLDVLAMIFEARRSGKHLSMLTPFNSFRKSAGSRNGDDTGFLEAAEILLVEDNRANRELVLRLLENMRCRATAVRNGEEAIDIVRRQPFDLILMDCQMPEMDGFEASAALRQMQGDGEIFAMPIIALTANAMKGDREKCLESGMSDYIAKPLRKTKLRTTLIQWLPPKGKRVADKVRHNAA